jgi:hypothetical protein
MTMERVGAKKDSNAGVPDRTVIDSDHCLIDREQRIAHFTMNPSRPLDTRFVHINEPTLFARSRRADLNYGESSTTLQYLIAYEDVLVKEKTKKPEKSEKNNPQPEQPVLRYATGGHADFDTRRDVIILTEFPQAYQGGDTVTGDRIVVHRDSDIVEVEHSNSFSQGSTEQ